MHIPTHLDVFVHAKVDKVGRKLAGDGCHEAVVEAAYAVVTVDGTCGIHRPAEWRLRIGGGGGVDVTGVQPTPEVAPLVTVKPFVQSFALRLNVSGDDCPRACVTCARVGTP